VDTLDEGVGGEDERSAARPDDGRIVAGADEDSGPGAETPEPAADPRVLADVLEAAHGVSRAST
jgi:hypothetical protein